jgi:hypothetical protein
VVDHQALKFEQERFSAILREAKGNVTLSSRQRSLGIAKSEDDPLYIASKVEQRDLDKIAAAFRREFPNLTENAATREQWYEMTIRWFSARPPEEQRRLLDAVADKASPQPTTSMGQSNLSADVAKVDRAIKDVTSLMERVLAKSEDGKSRLIMKFDTAHPSTTRKRTLVVEKEVRRLFDADVSHISLVTRASTRAPWKVLKSEGLRTVPALSPFDCFLSKVARGAA